MEHGSSERSWYLIASLSLLPNIWQRFTLCHLRGCQSGSLRTSSSLHKNDVIVCQECERSRGNDWRWGPWAHGSYSNRHLFCRLVHEVYPSNHSTHWWAWWHLYSSCASQAVVGSVNWWCCPESTRKDTWCNMPHLPWKPCWCSRSAQNTMRPSILFPLFRNVVCTFTTLPFM